MYVVVLDVFFWQLVAPLCRLFTYCSRYFPSPCWVPREYMILFVFHPVLSNLIWQAGRMFRNYRCFWSDQKQNKVFLSIPTASANFLKWKCSQIIHVMDDHLCIISNGFWRCNMFRNSLENMWGFPGMGVPPWLDGLHWKIPLKWMMTRGTPISGNPHMA